MLYLTYTPVFQPPQSTGHPPISLLVTLTVTGQCETYPPVSCRCPVALNVREHLNSHIIFTHPDWAQSVGQDVCLVVRKLQIWEAVTFTNALKYKVLLGTEIWTETN